MSSKMVSSVDPTIHLGYQSPKSQFPRRISHISFNSQLVASRISIRKQSGPWRARPTARIEALTQTLYEVLGIAEGCSSLPDIKKAYKQMARKYHPDVSPPERVDEYTRRFIMVHEAYETLSNPKTRAIYDRDLDAAFPFSPKKGHQGMVDEKEWRSRWQSQLEGLQRRHRRGGMSWGSRMRNASTH